MEIKYTEEQQLAIDNCVEFIHNKTDSRKWYTLTGPPGTGKTVSILGVLKQFQGKRIVASAISHIATNILQEHLKSIRVDTMTIAQLVGAQPSKSTKEIQFHINPRFSRIQDFSIILIDECSMIDENIFQVLLNMKRPDSKIIFIGDKYQLPPPADGKDSPSLNRIDSELTKIMRFEGPINKVVTETKKQLLNLENGYAANMHFINTAFGQNRRISHMENDTGYIFLKESADLIDLFLKEYNLDPTNINNTRMLLFRNNYVDTANNAIRKRLYGSNLAQFEKGEMIVSKGGYRQFGRTLVFNRETFRVVGIVEGVDVEGVNCIELTLDPMPHDKGRIVTPSIKDGGLRAYNRIREIKKEQSEGTNNWRILHTFDSKFSWWDYTYAQNLYLAQGKTYNSVFVIESEIHNVKPLQIKQKLQALYVGLSRAKKRLYIYNKKYKADGRVFTSKPEFKKLLDP